MALERWELGQRQRGNLAGAEMARVLREQYGDIPLMEDPIEGQDAVLQQAVAEYKTKPHTPELITATWQKIWQV